MIRVLIADDQVLLRESIAMILEYHDDMEVVGLAENGQEALELCQVLKPDMVLMDLEMPVKDGMTATKEIKEKCPGVRVVILTTFENPDSIMESFVARADGYLVKNIGHDDLALTVRCVAGGLTVIHESVREIMIDRFKGLSDYKSQYSDLLSDREIEIAGYIAKGLSNKDIAAKLFLSEGTIKNNITKLLGKLGMQDRMQIAVFAIENGID